MFVKDLGTAVADGLGRWSLSFDEDRDFIWPIAVLPPFDTGAGTCDPTSGWPDEPSPGSLVPEIFPNHAVSVSTIASAVDGVAFGLPTRPCRAPRGRRRTRCRWPADD